MTAGPRFLLTFTLVDWMFGMPLDGVQEVQRMVELVPLPQTPGGPKGVINLRGETMPVWELRTLLGFESSSINPEQNIVITQLLRERPSATSTPGARLPATGLGSTSSPLALPGGGNAASGRQGWIVDQVHEVIDTEQGLPAPLDGVPVAAYLSGVIRMGDGLILVLDVDRILLRTEERSRGVGGM